MLIDKLESVQEQLENGLTAWDISEKKYKKGYFLIKINGRWVRVQRDIVKTNEVIVTLFCGVFQRWFNINKILL